MSANKSTLINALKAEIVKYSSLENLKEFHTNHPEYGGFDDNIFSRNRRLPLHDLLPLLLYPRAKSTDIELLEFSHLIGKDNVNKSDFSKRRRLIPADYLKALHRDIVSDMYSGQDVLKWYGHLLLAADGTTYSLPNTPSVKKFFLQGRKTGRGEQALARGVVVKDVCNDVVVASNMECYGRDEISLLIDELNGLPDIVASMSPVLILDRKFCAYTLLGALLQKNFGFIIRVKERFNAEVDAFMASGETEREVTLTPSSTSIKKLKGLYGRGVACEFPVRLVRLSDNIVVMTSVRNVSLLDKDTDVYHLRWDDETTIGFFKNNLQIEIFSSSRLNSMRQDFYAKTIVYNIISALCHQAAGLRHDPTPRRINRNVALGILKFNFSLFVEINCQKFNALLHKVLKEMGRFTIPVKPGRHNPRVFRKIKHSGKYITLQNYREAI